MSYAKQVLCYMCSQVGSKAASIKPTAADLAAYKISGNWTDKSWLETPANYNAWAAFSKARVLDGVAPRLVGDWLYSVDGHSGKDGEAETDLGGTYPRVTKAGKLSRLKSAAAYHWFLAAGVVTPEDLCNDAFSCNKKDPQPRFTPHTRTRPGFRRFGRK